MPRFFYGHAATALKRFALPSGRVFALDSRGFLETCERHAGDTRQPLHGRLILQRDEWHGRTGNHQRSSRRPQ
jgi:hypothetical protein